MKIIAATNLACPLDGLPLQQQAQSLVCTNKHSFDMARQGYINLLPVQFKHSKFPGDNQAMVQARTAFLNTGAYLPISDRLNQIVLNLFASKTAQPLTLLDAGCGEGYYLTQLQQALLSAPGTQSVALIGLDISKPAILAASKRCKDITWLIATSKQPPLQKHSIDLIVCAFGYPMWAEFRQLLKPGGKIVLVDVGEDHLIELRQLLYKEVTAASPLDLSAAVSAGFTLSTEARLKMQCKLASSDQIMNLLKMTPHYYRASEAAIADIEKLTCLDVTVDVVFRVLDE